MNFAPGILNWQVFMYIFWSDGEVAASTKSSRNLKAERKSRERLKDF